MKKQLIALTLIAFLCACQKNLKELETDPENAKELAAELSKSAMAKMNTSSADATSSFADLANFPINIIVKENNTGNKYLTYIGGRQGYFGFKAKSTISNDSTQVYYLRMDPKGDLQIYWVDKRPNFDNYWFLGAGTNPRAGIVDTSILMKSEEELNLQSSPLYSWRIMEGAVNNDSYILRNIGYNKVLGNVINSDKVYFDSYTNTGRQEFEIRPVDDFELIDIEYINDASATITQRPDFVTQWLYSNNTSVQQSMSTSFSQKATETSSFSQTTGGSLSVSVGIKVGIPIFADGSINTTVTVNHSATYGKSESMEDAQTYNFPINVAPRTSVTATATVGRYLINLKYKAKMRGVKTGKLLTINGVWEGISCTTVRVDVDEHSLDNGKLLNHTTLKEVPKTTFSFKK